MRQFWTFFSLDRHEKYDVKQTSPELVELFFRSTPGNILKTLLRRPANSAFMIQYIEKVILKPAETDRAKSESLESNESLSGLEKLPNEIIYAILDYNDDLEDAVSFSLTCHHFWHIGKYHVIRVRDSLIAKNTWAGTRIICVGDAQIDDDWPSSIPEEEYESYLWKDDWTDRSGNPLPGLPFEHNGRSNLNTVENTIFGYLCEYYLLGNTFVLRNLSKKLYVVGDQFDKLLEERNLPRSRRVTLGHVAIAHICWSSHPPTTMDYDGPIHRGPWAGDRLEIVPINQHIQELQEEAKESPNRELEGLANKNTAEQDSSPECGWKDVTEDCKKLMADIWEAKYGIEWRSETLRAYASYGVHYDFDL